MLIAALWFITHCNWESTGMRNQLERERDSPEKCQLKREDRGTPVAHRAEGVLHWLRPCRKGPGHFLQIIPPFFLPPTHDNEEEVMNYRGGEW